MSREKFSAEDILLGIHFAKREVARTRPKKTPLEEGATPLSDRELFEEQIRFDKDLNCFIELDSEEYLSARNDLSRWNSRARRFCARREKELEGFPIEFETLKTKKEGSK